MLRAIALGQWFPTRVPQANFMCAEKFSTLEVMNMWNLYFLSQVIVLHMYFKVHLKMDTFVNRTQIDNCSENTLLVILFLTIKLKCSVSVCPQKWISDKVYHQLKNLGATV